MQNYQLLLNQEAFFKISMTSECNKNKWTKIEDIKKGDF